LHGDIAKLSGGHIAIFMAAKPAVTAAVGASGYVGLYAQIIYSLNSVVVIHIFISSIFEYKKAVDKTPTACSLIYVLDRQMALLNRV